MDVELQREVNLASYTPELAIMLAAETVVEETSTAERDVTWSLYVVLDWTRVYTGREDGV